MVFLCGKQIFFNWQSDFLASGAIKEVFYREKILFIYEQTFRKNIINHYFFMFSIFSRLKTTENGPILGHIR